MLKPYLGSDLDKDPVMGAVRDHFAESGKTQGEMDDLLGTLEVLAKKGLIEKPFDPSAEAVKLGERAEVRRREVETFAEGLKSRGELTEGEYGELMSLAPTADGVTLIEKMKGWMRGPSGPKIDGGAAPAEDPAMAEAKEMRQDARYENDPAFKRQADAKWLAAHQAKRAG